MKSPPARLLSLLLTLFLCNPKLIAQSEATQSARQLEAANQPQQAIVAWQTVLAADPKNAEALAHLGLIEARGERYTEAIGYYKRALALAPDLPGLELNLGLAYFKGGQFAQALRPFSDELRRHPDDPRSILLLGMAHYGMGDYLVAIPFLQRGAESAPDNLPLRLALAHSCLWSKQLDCVMATYKQIVTLNPQSAEAEMLAGEALDENGDDAGAIEHFRAAAAADPKEPNVHFGLGYLLWTETHYEEAAPEFAAELVNDPRHSQAQAYLGDCDLMLKRLPDAEAHLQQALALNPNAEIVHRDLGIVDAETGHNDKAEQELKQAIALDASDSAAHWRLARLLQAEGKRAEAAAEFKIVSGMKQHGNDQLLQAIPQASSPPTAK